eukprot:GHUV01022902.1.p1 GENE.GHUV01022902.1~~GHUV01022902.1.p1  ORF type:complete len:630 (+),score=179.74 GHUV01022902.1:127-2016(+)
MDGSRRRSTEGVRFADPGQPHKGPVGEGVAESEALGLSPRGTTGWGTGIRRRRHQIGLQQQYGSRPDISGSSRRMGHDRRLSSDSRLDNEDDHPASAGIASGNLQFLRSMQRRQFLSRRTSSSNFSTGGGSSSARFRIDAAAAFAAAAAAAALQPTHALPEFLECSSDDEIGHSSSAEAPADDTGSQLPPQKLEIHASSFAEAMQLADLLHSHSRSRSRRQKVSNAMPRNGRSRSQVTDSQQPFTWHEFLSTVQAIDYPVLVQEQQQASLAASLRASANAATLGPIAEGVESDSEPASKASAHMPGPPDPGFNTAFEGEGVASFSKGVAAAAAAAAAADGRTLSPRPPSGPKPATTSRGRPQQLMLDSIENEIASLGLQSGQAEPATPLLLVHGNSTAQTATAAADPAEAGGLGSPSRVQHSSDSDSREDSGHASGVWPGLKDHDSGSDSEGSTDRDSGGRALNDSSASSGKEPRIGSGDSRDSGSRPVKPRRVTLFTESMRVRHEGPQAPAESKHTYNPDSKPSHAGGSGLRASAAVRGSGYDDAADSTAAEFELDGGLAVGAGFDDSLLRNGAVASPEPSITAKAIKRRKAAAGVSGLLFQQSLASSMCDVWLSCRAPSCAGTRIWG